MVCVLLSGHEDLSLIDTTKLTVDPEVLLVKPLVDRVEETTRGSEGGGRGGMVVSQVYMCVERKHENTVKFDRFNSLYITCNDDERMKTERDG